MGRLLIGSPASQGPGHPEGDVQATRKTTSAAVLTSAHGQATSHFCMQPAHSHPDAGLAAGWVFSGSPKHSQATSSCTNMHRVVYVVVAHIRRQRVGAWALDS